MSTLDASTASRPLSSNLSGTKREACDRCRGQKLRCLRQDQSQDSPQAKCVRCFKAGATCNYGIPSRAGRPPGPNIPPPQRRKGNGGRKPKKDSKLVVDTSSHNGFLDGKADSRHYRRTTRDCGSDGLVRQNSMDREKAEEAENINTGHPLSPSSMHDTSNFLCELELAFPAFSEPSTTTLPWPSETLLPLGSNDGGENLNLEPFGPNYDWAFHQYQTQPMDIQIPTTSPLGYNKQSRNVAINAYEPPSKTGSTNGPLSGSLDEAMDLDLPSGSPHIIPLDPTKILNAPPSQSQDGDGGKTGISTRFVDLSSTAKSILLDNFTEEEAGIKFNEESPAVNQAQHGRMHELSELAMSLYTQLVANDPDDHQSTSDATPTAFQDRLVGSVLQSSNTFLTLLSSFCTPSTVTSSNCSVPSLNFDNSNCSSIDTNSGTSPSVSALEDDGFIAADQPHYGETLPASSPNDFQPPPSLPIDVTTILQLLVCHIRIVHLHSIMYARILDYVLTFLPLPITATKTQSVDSVVPPVFPQMQVGGVSLDRFGMFQIKLVLQISVHVLGEIELALGLPEEYRIGKKGWDKEEVKRGVLETNFSVPFVECLMREGVWKGEKERLERVRKQLEILRSVLKGTIEF